MTASIPNSGLSARWQLSVYSWLYKWRDEANPALCLAAQVSKMAPPCLLGITYHVLQEKFPWNQIILNPLLTKLVKMVEYWPHSFFVHPWTSSSSWPVSTLSLILANIQPFWPRTLSVTHVNIIWTDSINQGCQKLPAYQWEMPSSRPAVDYSPNLLQKCWLLQQSWLNFSKAGYFNRTGYFNKTMLLQIFVSTLRSSGTPP